MMKYKEKKITRKSYYFTVLFEPKSSVEENIIIILKNTDSISNLEFEKKQKYGAIHVIFILLFFCSSSFPSILPSILPYLSKFLLCRKKPMKKISILLNWKRYFPLTHFYVIWSLFFHFIFTFLFIFIYPSCLVIIHTLLSLFLFYENLYIPSSIPNTLVDTSIIQHE